MTTNEDGQGKNAWILDQILDTSFILFYVLHIHSRTHTLHIHIMIQLVHYARFASVIVLEFLGNYLDVFTVL
jgi:hypothetical protein